MIKYLGSKRVLIPLISEVIGGLCPSGTANGTASGTASGTVIDLFSGTSRVGHALKAQGMRVLSNDLNTYASTIATCYVQADAQDQLAPAVALIDELNGVVGYPGYFTETFCVQSRFFQPKNGQRVDGIRDEIARRALPPELEAIALTSLMEAADRVDSTTGVQMAFLKQWAPRSNKDLQLRVPALLTRTAAGKGAATQLDARVAARQLSGDVAYLDPPYNQHKYLGNYHIWETLVRWDAPEVYGIACKRVDCRDRMSPFNSKPRIHAAMAEIIANLDVRHLVLSFSNEGYLDQDQVLDLLSARGEVRVVERDHPRYVGARIGIHNASGEKVGKVSHVRNKEYLFIVSERGSKVASPNGVQLRLFPA